MKAKVYFCIGEYDDEIIIEGDTIEDLREKCQYEISRRGATYCGSEIIEEP